jgi:hypothetical protein
LQLSGLIVCCDGISIAHEKILRSLIGQVDALLELKAAEWVNTGIGECKRTWAG